MKLNNLLINHCLGISGAKIDLATPLTFIAARNAKGKTSIHDAINFVLGGTKGPIRGIVHKNKMSAAISDGAKEGFVAIDVDGTQYRRSLNTGNYVGSTFNPDLFDGLPAVLQAQSVADMTPKDRMKYLTDIASVQMSADDLAKRLDEHLKISHSDLDCTAQQYEIVTQLKGGIEGAARVAYAEWSKSKGQWEATTGEKYGCNKAEGWQPEGPEGANVESLERDLGMLQEESDNLSGALKDFMEHVCKGCGSVTYYIDGEWVDSKPETVSESERAETLEELNETKASIAKVETMIATLKDGETMAKQAAKYHETVKCWDAIRQALEPGGIPTEVREITLKPIRDRLKETALRTGWDVVINADGDIELNGRLYQLQSESEKWRSQAALAEAISFQSGLGVLLLDRFDVLDLQSRNKAFHWLYAISRSGAYDTVLVSGTSVEPPGVSNDVMSVYWIDGRVRLVDADVMKEFAGEKA